ncbi:hydrolase 1, exosortase A system-associated [Chitinivorax tropicus]|uniref:hydrolase 1, exosortase A system-associated n=1 Tax=Chitinivorax tropicus TaxID=714531 RepID=UPI0031B5B6EF
MTHPFQPFFLETPSGPRFCVHYPPLGTIRGAILYVHPFAEEMHKARRMAAEMARRFASNGWAVLCVDLGGCGDSAGDFGDASWAGWQADMQAAAQWLKARHGVPLTVWGLRLGALLAADLAMRDEACQRLLLWSPATNGEQFLIQFLRLKVANQMLAGNGDGAMSTTQLRQQLDAGQALEVAGYGLSPQLALPLASTKLADVQRAGLVVDWFEMQSAPDRPAPPVAEKLAQSWRDKGAVVRLHGVVGESFWNTQEITDVPALWDQTLHALEQSKNEAVAPVVMNDAGRGGSESARLSSRVVEQALTLSCQGESLPALLAASDQAGEVGVLIVVGGPQYRAGSHRQFTLLGRALAESGIPSLRFDYRGMGDATGPLHMFEQVTDDLRTAVDALFERQPGLRKVVIWGLCDAAAAALFYAWRDRRVSGLVLLNPWVRTEAGLAQAMVKHYYRQRLLSKDFWLKLFKGGVNVGGSIRELLQKISAARQVTAAAPTTHQPDIDASLPLPARMAEGLARFKGRVLFILSGDDLTAAEFREAVNASPHWQSLLRAANVQTKAFDEANHTFSRRAWRETVEQWTIDWIRE